jgi:hypothetical protein
MAAPPMRLRIMKVLRCVVGSLSMGFFACVASAQNELAELDDAAARMQYAYYTADTRALEEALGVVNGMEDSPIPGLKEYFQAYGTWKLAVLYADQHAAGSAPARSLSAKALKQCERYAKAAVASDARLAEAHALQALCSGAKPAGGDCNARALRTAVEMDALSPRVRLIQLMCTPDASSQAKLHLARDVVDAFERAPASRPGRPDWGQAEAFVTLGRVYLERGDARAARENLERALVLAPEYREAMELLRTPATSPR